MTDRRSNAHRQRRARPRQAWVLRCWFPLSAMALVASATLVFVATEPAHAQSDTVKKSNELLKDILRKRDSSQRRKTTPTVRSRKPERARDLRPAQSHGRFVGRWRLDANCTTGHYIITVNITSATAANVSGSTSRHQRLRYDHPGWQGHRQHASLSPSHQKLSDQDDRYCDWTHGGCIANDR